MVPLILPSYWQIYGNIKLTVSPNRDLRKRSDVCVRSQFSGMWSCKRPRKYLYAKYDIHCKLCVKHIIVRYNGHAEIFLVRNHLCIEFVHSNLKPSHFLLVSHELFRRWFRFYNQSKNLNTCNSKFINLWWSAAWRGSRQLHTIWR